MKTVAILSFVLFSIAASAQSALPVIRATSKQVSIKDGTVLTKNAWTLTPGARPDVYTAERTRKTKQVIFYTDTDSIAVTVNPGSHTDFIILLHGKDSCYTRVESAIPPKDNIRRNIRTQDTIPFILTAHEAISVRAVINEQDTVLLHFDTGSWDVRLTRAAVVHKTSLLPRQQDGSAPDFSQTGKIARLQIGSMVIQHPTLQVTGLTAHDMDGRFGWNIFEGKQVELDYDHNRMIVHSGKAIRIPKDYVRTEMVFRQSFMIVKGKLKKGAPSFDGDFLMDTGAESAVILDSSWAADTDFAEGLPPLRSITLSNPAGIKFETKVVTAPALILNGYTLINVPALVLNGRNPAGFPVNTLGNDVLKRFNMILDFRHDQIYWKPNGLYDVDFRKG